jgi:hypothetical protein
MQMDARVFTDLDALAGGNKREIMAAPRAEPVSGWYNKA